MILNKNHSIVILELYDIIKLRFRMNDLSTDVQSIERYFSLKSISDRKTKHIEVVIPDLQRGLVWNPKQVEFLWDSILRGFPIGGFVLSERDQKTDGDELKQYYLMDGQQRFNAIELGFTEPSEDTQSLLWIDIEPGRIMNSTRKYFIKATTIAHPWGYHSEDDCKRLTAGERQEALEVFGLKGKNIYKDDIKLTQTFPYCANIPIPFAYILKALYELEENEEKLDVFVNKVLEKCNNSECSKWKEKKLTDENLKQIKYWLNNNFNNLLLLKNYEVTYNLLPKSIYEKESDEKKVKIENTQEAVQTDLEILFQRLNDGGTKISNDDLIYSAIKAYWGSIKEQNENMAKGLMPPQNLIQIVFRLLITEINKGKTDRFESPLSIKKIRNLSKDGEIKEYIENFYKDEKLTNRIRNQLFELAGDGEKCLPKYVLMTIINKQPDVILFAIYLIINKKIEGEKLIGLVLYLFWFSLNTNDVINKLYQKCKDSNDPKELFCLIKEGIAELTYEKKMVNVYSPSDLEELTEKHNQDLRELINNTPEGKFINLYMWNPQSNTMSKTLLLYAQRHFLYRYFSNFNPADTVAWEEHNCPWDYDHIYPQNNVNIFNQSDCKDNVKFWLCSIGNFAAIPFEVNRSKSDSDNYAFYKEDSKEGSNKEELKYNEKFELLTSTELETEEKKSNCFEEIVFNRMIDLYSDCYKSFEEYVPVISGEAEKRKNLMVSLKNKIEIKSKCEKCKPAFYFVREGNDLHEYELHKDIDWFRFCISLKTPFSKFNNSDCMISFTWNHFNHSLEIGLRGVNIGEEKRNFLNSNNLESSIDNVVKNNSYDGIISNFIGETDQWWYKKYHLKLKENEFSENHLENIANLYISLFNSV